MAEELLLKGTQRRFWGLLVPAYLICSIILIRFSFWGLKVFHPKVDMPLRTVTGYGPLVVIAFNLILLIALYWKFTGMSFQFTTSNLVFKHHGRRFEFPWEEVRIHQEKRIAVLNIGRRRVVIHKFFFNDLARLCKLVNEARAYSRRDWGTGPA